MTFAYVYIMMHSFQVRYKSCDLLERLHSFKMNTEDRDVLRRHRLFLLCHLRLNDDFFQCMTRSGIINDRIREMIESKPTPTDERREFLDALTRRGPMAFHYFLCACVETGQNDIVHTLTSKNKVL